MIYYLSQWILELSDARDWPGWISPLRLFSYISFRSGGAFLTAFILSLILGPHIINRLIAFKCGQNYIDIAGTKGGRKEETSRIKVGVPSMGGILIHITLLSSTLLWAQWNGFVILCLVGTVTLATVGFYDDYLKIRKKNGLGASGKIKICAQAAVSALVMAYLVSRPETLNLISEIYLPFRAEPLTGLTVVGALLTFLTITGSSNAVNLTDGMDGLAIGCTIIVSFVFLVVTYVTGHAVFAEYLKIAHVDGAGELTVICAALIGSGLGFLWYNSHPAQVFMGDTGSLALGGLLGIIAVQAHQPVMLLLAGGVFVMEAISVIVQRYYFKYTRRRFGEGRRVFLMAPIHHHFEKLGWPETKVVVRFYIIGILFGTLALITLKIR